VTSAGPEPGPARRVRGITANFDTHSRRYARLIYSWRILAPLAAALTGATLVVIGGLRAGREQRLTTPVGGYTQAALPDKSVAELNTNSQIRYSFDEEFRPVTLASGEAHFKVAPDADRRPFFVFAGSMGGAATDGAELTVRVRGPQNVEMLVSAGSVTWVSEDRAVKSITVRAGELAVQDRKALHVRKIDAREMSARQSWRQGVLTFSNITLTEAVAEFNRYNEEPIVIADPSIANIRISGQAPARQLDGFMSLLKGRKVDATLWITGRRSMELHLRGSQ
jgi:transmembrane sensor